MSELERSADPSQGEDDLAEEGFSDDAAEQAAAALARAAIDEPLFPRAPRCPRCGERLASEGVAEEGGEPRYADACGRCRAGTITSMAGERLVPIGSRRREVLRGLGYLLRGLLRLRSPGLWKPAGVLLLVNVALGGLLFFFFCYGAEGLAGSLHTMGQNAENETGVMWLAGVAVRWGLAPAANLLPYGVGPLVGAWVVLGFPLNLIAKAALLPFMDKLGATTEAHVLDLPTDERREAEQLLAGRPWRVALDALVLTGAQGALALLLLPLGFVPYVGGLAWLLVPPVVFAALDYSSLHLLRRGYRLDERVRLWRRHYWRFLGFGLGFTLLLAVPLVGALLLPAAAAGLCLLYLGLPRK